MSGGTPKIAVPVRSFSNAEILRRELLENFPGAAFNDTGKPLKGDDLVRFLDGMDGAVIGLEPINDEVLDRLPDLKIVAKYGVGMDGVDTEACARHGVEVGWTGGVNRLGVAEMVLCFMIGLMRDIFVVEHSFRDERWAPRGGRQLSGRTVGIIGVGHVGKEVVRLLAPFECEILVNDVIDQSRYYREHGLIEASKDEICERADIVTVHTPLDETTRHMFDASVFKRMKRTAFLVNAARGAIVKQDDLKQALKDREIAGAALDVFEFEPPNDLELTKLPNLFCTAHTGGSAYESILAMGRSAIGHLAEHFGVAAARRMAK